MVWIPDPAFAGQVIEAPASADSADRRTFDSRMTDKKIN